MQTGVYNRHFRTQRPAFELLGRRGVSPWPSFFREGYSPSRWWRQRNGAPTVQRSLTMYQPNFCADCGAKVLRRRWHLWTSRRFCEGCARRLRKIRLLPVFWLGITLLTTGYLAGRGRRPPAPPLTIERRSNSPLSDSAPSGATNPAGAQSANTAVPPAPIEVVADVYLCGARTKKGTPCSRRVHGPVRCWQHKGMPAMLPQEKLRIKDLAP